ncbi:MAG TPA: hypothetical protein VMZ33_04675 [Candidatus Limnocylindrales bacterium]|nr:hypothetical protein [Candidatus Limnocylindrales bacterium]
MGRVPRAEEEVHLLLGQELASLERQLDHGSSIEPESDALQEGPIEVGSAIDIGSNSVHLLVAVVGEGWLEPLRDTSELLGLGDVVDRDGSIPKDSRKAVVDVLADYVGTANRSQSEHMTLLGTEPLRRASNADTLAAEIFERTGESLHVLSEHGEALLTFIGVTRGVQPRAPLIVVDIGGGSTEVATWLPGQPLETRSIPLGSARLSKATIEHDPPTDSEMNALAGAALDATADLAPLLHRADLLAGARAIFVGGTATNIARLGTLSRDDLARDRATLTNMPTTTVTTRYNVKPRRARQLAAGVAIVDAILERFELDTAEASDASLRDGAIIARCRLGEEWPERLDELVGYPALSR